MRTTLNLPDRLMKEAIAASGIHNKTMLITRALEEMLKAIHRENLKKMRGSIALDVDLVSQRRKDMI